MPGLAFLYPAFLIGLLAAAVPIIIHLLRREAAPQMPFSAVRLLRRAPVEQVRRKRLREILLLALRATALALLAMAFARPYLEQAVGASAAVTVVAVDVSYSMGAPGAFDRARDLARAAVRGAAPGDLVAVMAFDDRAALVAEPSRDRAAALDAIDRLEPGFGTTRYRTAMAQAATAIGARPGRVVVVTDLQHSGLDIDDRGAVPDRIDVEVADVGAPAGNLAVTSVRSEPAQVVATVFNAGLAPASSRARLREGDRLLAEQDFTVEPGLEADTVFVVELPQSGSISVKIDDPDGYPADDERFLVLDPSPGVPMLIVGSSRATGRDAFYVERALAADEAARYEITVTAAAELRPDGRELERYAAIVLLATRGLERRAREALADYVQRGGGLLVAAAPDVEAAVVGSLLGGTAAWQDGSARDEAPGTLAPADARHPIFRPFGSLVGHLGQVRFRRAVRFEEEDVGRTIARFSDGRPALAERQVGDGRVLLFASDLRNEWNDFPLHPTFVPFVHETMRYLSGERERPDEYLIGSAPPEVPRRPGIAAIGDPARRVAVNVDTSEASAGRLTEDEFGAAIGRLQEAAAGEAQQDARAREAGQSLWRYGLMLVLLALVAEGVVGRRMAG